MFDKSGVLSSLASKIFPIRWCFKSKNVHKTLPVGNRIGPRLQTKTIGPIQGQLGKLLTISGPTPLHMLVYNSGAFGYSDF